MSTRKFKIAVERSIDAFEEYLKEEHFEHHGLFNFVVRAMKFTYEYYPTGYRKSHLPPNVTVGVDRLHSLLNRSEVDFVPTRSGMTEERWDTVAFNYPDLCGDLTFISNKPRYHPEIMAIFRTLSAPVWLSLLTSMILVTLVTFVVLKHRHTLDDVVLHVLAIVLNQGGNIIPQRVGEVLLLFTWMVAMALFTACFKSVLLSFLSFPPLTGVRTVPELAAAIRAGKYSATSNPGNFIKNYLKGSTNEDIRLIGENIFKNPPVYMEDLFDESLDQNVVSVLQRYYANALKEKFYVSKDSMGIYLLATAVRKDFCCKEEMNTAIHRFLAAGIDQKIRSFRDFRTALRYVTNVPDEDALKKITLTDISGAFIILITGYVLSAVVLIIELLKKRLDMRRSSNVQE